jgi:hypothetical protein
MSILTNLALVRSTSVPWITLCGCHGHNCVTNGDDDTQFYFPNEPLSWVAPGLPFLRLSPWPMQQPEVGSCGWRPLHRQLTRWPSQYHLDQALAWDSPIQFSLFSLSLSFFFFVVKMTDKFIWKEIYILFLFCFVFILYKRIKVGRNGGKRHFLLPM